MVGQVCSLAPASLGISANLKEASVLFRQCVNVCGKNTEGHRAFDLLDVVGGLSVEA